MINNTYDDKSLEYFSNIRKDIISFIGNKKDLAILEIGAGNGSTLLELKRLGIAKSIYGYDIMDLIQNKTDFEQFIVGNIEKEEIPFNQNFFDIIIIADVLEHLIEPEQALKKISKHLKKEGEIYISLPNIRYFKAVYQIFFKGDFKYEEEGILDKTHLRFFCKKNMIELISKTSGLSLVKMESNLKHTSSNKSLLNKLTFRIFEGFLSLQFFLKVKKSE